MWPVACDAESHRIHVHLRRRRGGRPCRCCVAESVTRRPAPRAFSGSPRHPMLGRADRRLQPTCNLQHSRPEWRVRWRATTCDLQHSRPRVACDVVRCVPMPCDYMRYPTQPPEWPASGLRVACDGLRWPAMRADAMRLHAISNTAARVACMRVACEWHAMYQCSNGCMLCNLPCPAPCPSRRLTVDSSRIRHWTSTIVGGVGGRKPPPL